MAIRIYCLHCGQRIKAQDDMGGMRVLCPTCGERVQIPHVEKPTAKAPKAGEIQMQTAQFFTAEDYAPTPTQVNYHKEPIDCTPDLAVKTDTVPLNRVRKVKVWRGSMYICFLLAFLPLAFHVFFGQTDNPLQRLEKGIENLSRDRREKAERVYQLAKQGRASLEDVFDQFPDKKVPGAWLPRDTDLHYALAVVSFVGFLFMLGACLPKGFSRFALMLVIAIFTGTMGIAILLFLQFMATSGLGILALGPFGIIVFIIGISYRVALDPTVPFLSSFLGFTLGVGLAEEIVKAMPIFLLFLGRKRLRWHQCCALGMASGVGFGVAEGLHYSAEFYNGLFDANIYFIRFISCVMLHAVWSGAAALFLHRFQSLTHGDMTFMKGFMRLLVLISIPMVLHGLYDTLLKKEIDGIALTVALLSFGWLALMIETARETEGDLLVEITPDTDPRAFEAMTADRPLTAPTPNPHLPAMDYPSNEPAANPSH